MTHSVPKTAPLEQCSSNLGVYYPRVQIEGEGLRIFILQRPCMYWSQESGQDNNYSTVRGTTSNSGEVILGRQGHVLG